MSSMFLTRLPCGILLFMAGVTAAQAAAPVYQSAYSDYQPYRDEALRPWRDVNDEVARVGGHIGIFGGGAQHGQTPQKPASPPAAPASGSATKPGHANHH